MLPDSGAAGRTAGREKATSPAARTCSLSPELPGTILHTRSRVSPTCRSLSSGKAPLSCLLCSVVSRDPISEPCLDQTVGKLPLRRKIWEVKVKSLSHVRLFATPWTVAYQVPLSVGFSRQDYWSGLPFPSPGGSGRCALICDNTTRSRCASL